MYVALLRAVNLSGATQVGMSDLRELLARLGLADPRTLLQSGNAVFQSEEDAGSVTVRIEGALRDRYGRAAVVIVRSADEWAEIVRRNPFPGEATSDPAHLLVCLLRDSPPPRAWKALSGSIRGRERVMGAGREGYLVYPDGIGRSKLTAAVIEKALGTTGTSRNWNTVLRIEKALHESPRT